MVLDDSFLEGAFAALKETLRVSPQIKRDMIQFLLDEGFWPEDMKWPTAEARFNSCLSPSKSEFFKISELWALMKQFGRHQLFLAMAEDLGYEVRRRTELERVQLLLEEVLDRLNDRDERDRKLIAQLQGLSIEKLEAGKPAPGTRVKFSRADRAC